MRWVWSTAGCGLLSVPDTADNRGLWTVCQKLSGSARAGDHAAVLFWYSEVFRSAGLPGRKIPDLYGLWRGGEFPCEAPVHGSVGAVKRGDGAGACGGSVFRHAAAHPLL